MNKIVLNKDYGGFGLSLEAVKLYNKLAGKNLESYEISETVKRHDPILVQVVETLGPQLASGKYASLAIETIEGNKYIINEYDGLESIQTPEDIKWNVI